MLKFVVRNNSLNQIWRNLYLGLEVLEKRKIIHRDVRPESLLFDSKGFVYLSGFGISQKYDNACADDKSQTPSYMAPEILMDRPFSFSSDVYSMGVVLYEIITQSLPYDGETSDQVKTVTLISTKVNTRSSLKFFRNK